MAADYFNKARKNGILGSNTDFLLSRSALATQVQHQVTNINKNDIMVNDNKMILNWIRTGIFCGLLASIIYPLLIFVPLPDLILVFLVMALGPVLSLGSVGLYFFLKLDKAKLISTIAMVANIVAGTLITTMLLVQIAIRESKPDLIADADTWIWSSINHIHYGIDVSWDVYIFIGTLLFSIAMYDHPRLGKVFSVIGAVISIAMIILNAISFPDPPASSGLMDLGPFIGLWYLAVTIKILLAYKSYSKKLLA